MDMRALKAVRTFAEYAVGLVFPETCVFCHRPVEDDSPDSHICKACFRDMPKLDYDKSLKLSGRSFAAFDIRGLGIYEYESIRDTIFLFKYEGFKRYGDILGSMMAEYVMENDLKAILEADMVVPVPLWKDKEAARGFNQAELMARRFSEMTGIPCENRVLARIRDTAPQSRLRRHQRHANIRSAFRVTDEDKVRGRIILLLDDIYTTGSTIRECAKNLYAVGAAGVMYIALAAGENLEE